MFAVEVCISNQAYIHSEKEEKYLEWISEDHLCQPGLQQRPRFNLQFSQWEGEQYGMFWKLIFDD